MNDKQVFFNLCETECSKNQVVQSFLKPVLQQKFDVQALFGLTVRDLATEVSDVDILVSFDGFATSSRYFGVQFYLEDNLGCTVDLVTDQAVRPELRPFIEREAVRV